MKSLNNLIKTLILSMLVLSACQAQNHRQEDRLPAVSGSFYPASGTQLVNQLEEFFNSCDKVVESQALALIVPNAGYVF